ncbi:uncharacterized protein LOC110441737 [Mizuhopecten yessoensis]|uniref:uncharacterized protein LOC110441737 n=1 Tax=Mizuhopecten yessoensis TaxID=6573 RepID=UPI000B45B558|nr:uncharacterized protein LOC110441737 [Mizuhopecten yessoensis]
MLSARSRQGSLTPILERACAVHLTKKVSVVCTTCDNAFICTKCISAAHKGHSYIDLEDFLDSKEQNISEFLDLEDIDNKIATKHEQIEKLAETISENRLRTDNVIQEVKTRADELKTEIDKIATDLIRECKVHGSKNLNSLEKLEQSLTRHLACLKAAAISHQNLPLDSSPFDDMLRRDSLKEESQADIPSLTSLMFIKQEEHSTILRTLFGSLRCISANSPSNVANLPVGKTSIKKALSNGRVLDTLTGVADGKHIQAIFPCDDNAAWLVPGKSHRVRLTTRKGEIIQTISLERGVVINDIMRTADKYLTTICCDDGSVRQILPSGRTQYLFSTGINISNICELSASGYFIACHSIQRKLVKYNQRGDIIETVDRDTYGVRLFTKPVRVRINRNNGDIAVVEWSSPEHVVIMNEKLQVISRFFGDSKRRHSYGTHGSFKGQGTKEKGHFDPADVIFTKNNHIIIADVWTNSLVMIDRNGKKLKTSFKFNFQPLRLGLQPNGDLWVGSHDGHVQIMKF